ncbi:MAG: hypothetical protein M9894_15890 [Planctomycetes bacterium]|nr:hypothetical protein [Planctomycetota bacterium]
MDGGDDPIRDRLQRHGIHVERREASQLRQMLFSGVGGIAGTAVAAAAGAGWLGRAVASLGGSVVGVLVATHRITYEPVVPRDAREPEDPRRWSDRR